MHQKIYIQKKIMSIHIFDYILQPPISILVGLFGQLVLFFEKIKRNMKLSTIKKLFVVDCFHLTMPIQTQWMESPRTQTSLRSNQIISPCLGLFWSSLHLVSLEATSPWGNCTLLSVIFQIPAAVPSPRSFLKYLISKLLTSGYSSQKFGEMQQIKSSSTNRFKECATVLQASHIHL